MQRIDNYGGLDNIASAVRSHFSAGGFEQQRIRPRLFFAVVQFPLNHEIVCKLAKERAEKSQNFRELIWFIAVPSLRIP